MGRNSGGQIHWTIVPRGGLYDSTFYCQQHARWDVRTNATLNTAWNKLRNEIDVFHGNEEQ